MAVPEPGCCDGPNELLRKILLGLMDISEGGIGGPVEIDDEGVPLTLTVESINFTGGGVTSTTVGNDVTVTVPGSAVIPVQDEGIVITPAVTQFNFTGTGVTATAAGNNVTVNVPAVAATVIPVQDEGIQITAAVAQFNFVGAGVTATAAGNNVTVTIPNVGDVVGPAGAVADRIATFNGATGKLIKDSGVLISSIVTTTTLQSGSQAIGSGVDTISVVFGTAFASAPAVVATMSRPVAEGLIDLNIDEASITTTGFTASLGATTGSANYRLKWMAK